MMMLKRGNLVKLRNGYPAKVVQDQDDETVLIKHFNFECCDTIFEWINMDEIDPTD